MVFPAMIRREWQESENPMETVLPPAQVLLLL